MKRFLALLLLIAPFVHAEDIRYLQKHESQDASVSLRPTQTNFKTSTAGSIDQAIVMDGFYDGGWDFNASP